MKSGFKFLISAGFFSACINLIYLAIPIYMSITYDRVLFSASLATLYTLGTGVLICLGAMGLIDYARRRIMIQAAGRLIQKLRPMVLNSLPGYPKGLDDLECLGRAVAGGHILGFLNLPWMLMYLIILYLIHPMIGGISAAVVIIAGSILLLLRILGKKRYIAADLAFRDNIEQFQNTMVHRELVSAMGLYPQVKERYLQTDDKTAKLKLGADNFICGTQAALNPLYILGLTLVFSTGVIVFFSDEITVGAVFASVIILLRLFGPLEIGRAHV